MDLGVLREMRDLASLVIGAQHPLPALYSPSSQDPSMAKLFI